jgi:S1-C subfamily serine protease
VPRKGKQEDAPNNQSPRIDERRGSGTGFFVTDDGIIMTAAHVVQDAGRVSVLTSAGELPAKVLAVDLANDIAVLKVTGKFIALPLVSSVDMKMGANVFTMGFPNPNIQGFNPKVSKGDISGVTGIQDDPREFQVSVPVQPGNSGGALVDGSGNVVGIMVMRLGDAATVEATGMLPQNVNYAIKSSYILPLLEGISTFSQRRATARTGKPRGFEEVVKEVQAATVMVVVY